MSKQQTAAAVLSYAASAGSSVANFISPLLSSSLKSATGYSSTDTASYERDIDKFYHVQVRPLLDAVDQLRGLLDSEPIKLPSIVVVGDQSSGKSSVLEALSGVALPRGREITTRCPLILRLINITPDTASSNSTSTATQNNNTIQNGTTKNGYTDKAGTVVDGVDHDNAAANGSATYNNSTSGSNVTPRPYAYLSLSPTPSPKDVRITNLDDIGPRITALTAQLAGHHAGIVATPIYLSVYRAHSPDLTLVDLPGITRNPIHDQPKDIYQQIKAMIMQYITPEETVILCVMPATVDLPTCECVMMSKLVDPQCDRTIGVITKLDLAETGIRRKLESGVEQLGLKLGVVAVRNRSHEENERGVGWEVAREMERMFFRQHKELASLAQDLDSDHHTIHHTQITSPSSAPQLYLGTNNLAHLLTTIQEHKIRSTLPVIRSQIRELLQQKRNKLLLFPPACSSSAECRMRLDHLLSVFLSHLSALCRGDHSIAKGDTKLHISPRLAEMYTTFKESLHASASPHLTYDYAKTVEEEIKENSGVTLPNFLSHQVFDGLMRKELERVRTPAVTCIDQVRQLLSIVLIALLRLSFQPYPQLLNRLSSMLMAFLDEKQRVLLERVDELIGEEEDIYTQNAYYLDVVSKIKAVLYDRLYGGTAKEREERERQQDKRERERHLSADAAQTNKGQSKGWLLSLSAVPSSLINAAPNAAQNAFNSFTNPSTCHIFTVNDLTITVDLAAVTLPTSALTAANVITTTAASSGSSSPSSSLFPNNTILDMQINCYAYTILAFKRLADAIPMLIRYHLVRPLSSSSYSVAGSSSIASSTTSSSASAAASAMSSSLSLRLQKELNEIGEKALLDLMREDKDVAYKREKLQQSVSRLEKSLTVLDNV